ncbi:ABC transporter ATP-binding protein [Stigmatella erecta]|uniref:Branched-chain amino acid transport system ATP-binding protein/neutral amino acid transport system ATP-binding protein n=1 Tax=Stigmatella erecta TaxID=83460 RepID=A0A1I0L6X8_9BACT|nr:ABC transporter ATP-binding protein [Stigmatella erecta]SEU35721.1 branched-chain amino acid transport system ATP-binding protein/neutral amino acid transport system ATP-binding protein [Stigmatella erecta]
MTPLLLAEGLFAGYGNGDIVRGVSLQAGAGRITTVMGPNGSGKSTFIKVLAGLVPCRQGRILLEGQEVTHLAAPLRVAAGLGYVPQEFNVFRNLTVRENLDLASAVLHRGRRDGKAGLERVFELFPVLSRRLKSLAGNLSGGERQMLAFASALLARPRFLLLDEPSAGLSPKAAEEMFQTVARVHATGVGVLMVEQNVAGALAITHDVMVLVGGAVRLATTAEDLKRQHDLHQLYLGPTEGAALEAAP